MQTARDLARSVASPRQAGTHAQAKLWPLPVGTRTAAPVRPLRRAPYVSTAGAALGADDPPARSAGAVGPPAQAVPVHLAPRHPRV